MSMLWLDFIAKIKVLNWPFLCYDGISSPDFHLGLQEHNVQCDTNVAVHTVISKCFFLLFILRLFRLYCKVSGLSLAWNVPHSAFHCFYSCSLLEQVASKGRMQGGIKEYLTNLCRVQCADCTGVKYSYFYSWEFSSRVLSNMSYQAMLTYSYLFEAGWK